ncbi:hypothetical protein SPF06_19515 [Sinomonas sp. JGH33]|uniref:HNH nuclease domain-containing protein n=1 Tax=Sinomonas terricola TaxID=3110330 RepID=A0ABU5TB43_9MICC|nr:hypothetical protein [Sinomonas sp. JGH33]MEA5456917.1 hypothetical protein [Sinomonas sp. JGH33]
MTGVLEERFWAKVVKGPRPDDCWIWTGAVADDGYGRFSYTEAGRHKSLRPNRLAYALVHGRELAGIDDPLAGLGEVMHHCDVPICVHAAVAPDESHLHEGTNRENMIDRAQKGRATNGSALRWRGLPRADFAARSRALRDEVRAHGWGRPGRIAALMGGADPDAPTLF